MQQYVIEFKLLKFDDNWTAAQPILLPQGSVYMAQGKAELRVVAELEPGHVKTYVFNVPEGKVVGVSVPENLVFIPVNDPPPPPLDGVVI